MDSIVVSTPNYYPNHLKPHQSQPAKFPERNALTRSANLRTAIEGELAMLQKKLVKQRDALQRFVDENSAT